MMYQKDECSDTRMRSCRAGFTLFEMVIVAGIIGALLAFIVPQILQYRESSRKKTAENTLLQIKQAIVLYETDIGKNPSTLKDLVSLPKDPEIPASKWLQGGYMGGKKQMPKDPWGNSYMYKLTPEGERQYELYSYGPGGRKAPKAQWIKVHEL